NKHRRRNARFWRRRGFEHANTFRRWRRAVTSLRDAIIGSEHSDERKAQKAHDEFLQDELRADALGDAAGAGTTTEALFANLPRCWRKPLFKGVYAPGEAIAVLNSHFMVG